jgi:hypothetical protein
MLQKGPLIDLDETEPRECSARVKNCFAKKGSGPRIRRGLGLLENSTETPRPARAAPERGRTKTPPFHSPINPPIPPWTTSRPFVPVRNRPEPAPPTEPATCTPPALPRRWRRPPHPRPRSPRAGSSGARPTTRTASSNASPSASGP